MVLKRSQSMQLVNSPCPESLGTIRQLSVVFWTQNHVFALPGTVIELILDGKWPGEESKIFKKYNTNLSDGAERLAIDATRE